MCDWLTTVSACLCICAPLGCVPTLTPKWCLCVCWLTACQHSEHTHMAGGWDIPAQTLQAQTPPLSREAAAPVPGAQARVQKFTQILHRLPTRSHTATTRRYQRWATHSSALYLLCLCLACLSFPLVEWLRLNSLQGVVAFRQLLAGVGRDTGMRNACELEWWRRDSIGEQEADVALGISAWVSCQQAES